jgi:competence protein ComEA
VTASTAPPTEIVVSVTGLVAHPGVVTLPVGARVTDAIAASGGSTAEADLTGLNLAAKLADGDSVVIAAAAAGAGKSGVSSTGSADSSSPGNPGASSGQQSSSQLVDLNSADEAALDSLPGVGPVMAQNILAWREQNGRFSSIEQLQEISGIGPARYAQISALVTVS